MLNLRNQTIALDNLDKKGYVAHNGVINLSPSVIGNKEVEIEIITWDCDGTDEEKSRTIVVELEQLIDAVEIAKKVINSKRKDKL